MFYFIRSTASCLGPDQQNQTVPQINIIPITEVTQTGQKQRIYSSARQNSRTFESQILVLVDLRTQHQTIYECYILFFKCTTVSYTTFQNSNQLNNHGIAKHECETAGTNAIYICVNIDDETCNLTEAKGNHIYLSTAACRALILVCIIWRTPENNNNSFPCVHFNIDLKICSVSRLHQRNAGTLLW